MKLRTVASSAARAQPRAERGYTVTFQATYYVFLLFMFAGLIYDFGGLGLAVSISSNAARLAAQDAAKNIDLQTYIDTQEIRLSADALTAARNLVFNMTAGRVKVISVSVNRLAKRDVIVVRAGTTAQMPMLGSVFGLAPVTFSVEASAEPAYGIAVEGQ
ncbi:MAG: hypothetical protein ABIQ99_11215 [Thermoflexales bacterium]